MASDLEYKETSPNGKDADVIRCVWSLRGQAAGGSADPIVSDGCVELVFNLADPFEHVAETGRATRQPLAMVVGPTALPTVVRPTGTIDIVGIRLQPWAGARVLGLPMHELRDRFEPLADVVGNRLVELPEQLHGLRDDDARLEFASRALAMRGSRAVNSVSRAAVEQVPRSVRDAPSVRELARHLGRSVRTLQRVFAEDVGLSPKTLLRIARIQRALALARASTLLRWSAIAVRAGYHDQSHFVRDFRELVGGAPSEFRPEEASLTASFLSKQETPRTSSP